MTEETRTQQEILDRIKLRKAGDYWGFEVSSYLIFLTYENIKTLNLLKDGVAEEDWNESYKNPTKDIVEQVMKDYMPFAWSKANNCRGISANRSIGHYVAWLWMYNDEEFSEQIENEYEEEYTHYGKEILIKICEKFGWDWKQWDDGVRTNNG